MNFWILTGNEENWETALNSNIWGVRKGRLVRCWESLQKGDTLFFYVKSPVSGLIGVGEVESKFKQNKPLWPDEIRGRRVIYPYRFGFKVFAITPPERWATSALKIRDLNLGIQAGVNPVSNADIVQELLKRVGETWNLPSFVISKKDFLPVPKPGIRGEPSLHDQIRDKLCEIGHLTGFISEKEYQIDGERLDVTWRRVTRGVPTRAFEVQVGGSPHQALAKLKHAFDLWNSEPFLIIDSDSRRKVNELLSGTFHELEPHIKVIPLEKVEEFYQSLKNQQNLRGEFGLE